MPKPQPLRVRGGDEPLISLRRLSALFLLLFLEPLIPSPIPRRRRLIHPLIEIHGIDGYAYERVLGDYDAV